MSQLATPFPLRMTEAEFLDWPGDGSGRRFHLIDGEVRPMSPASRIHGVIQANLAFLLVAAVRALPVPLQVITEGAIILLPGGGNVRVPDLVVAPDADERGDQAVTDPILVVEILSPGNGAATRENVRAHATSPGMRDIAVIHTGRMQAELHARDGQGVWQAKPTLVERGGRLRLGSIGLDCLLDDVYANTWLTRR